MAFLWKHPNCKYWQARFYDRDRKRRNRSTRVVATERNRRKAQKIADEYEEAAANRRTAAQVRRVIAELHQELTGEEVATVTLREHVARWLDRKKGSISESTHVFYKGATNKFVRFLGEKADRDLAEITRDDITRFRDDEASRLSPTSVNHGLKCVRMLFKDAMRDGLVAEDPSAFVEVLKKDSAPKVRPFKIPELRLVIEAADEEWRSLILFGLYTGQRLGDLATLTWDNLDLERHEVRLVTSKTGRRQTIPMALPLQEHVESLEASDEPGSPVHPRANAIVEKQGKTGNLSNQFADLLSQVGLRKKVSHRSKDKGRSSRRDRTGLSFHSLRHTATSLLHEAGIPVSVAQELIGHDSAEIHKGYVTVGDKALKKAAKAFPTL